MPLASEVLLTSFLGRRYFDIPESDYVFLFFFDVRSYYTRKNPYGVIDAFRKLLSAHPYARTKLVLKVHGEEINPDVITQLKDALSDVASHVILINRSLSDNEVKNLVRCCDCFVSLHRSEGYGRGIAEAMLLGKPVIATGYSGNMDFFINPEVAFNVQYGLVPVKEGEYPHYQGQHWAEPDINEAARYMMALVDDPEKGRRLGKNASLHMRTKFGYRASGLRYRSRLENIFDDNQ